MQSQWEERIWICGRVCRPESRADRKKRRSRITSPVEVRTLALDTLLRTLVTLRVRELNGKTRDREREEEASSLSARRATVFKSQWSPSSHTAADGAS